MSAAADGVGTSASDSPTMQLTVPSPQSAEGQAAGDGAAMDEEMAEGAAWLPKLSLQDIFQGFTNLASVNEENSQDIDGALVSELWLGELDWAGQMLRHGPQCDEDDDTDLSGLELSEVGAGFLSELASFAISASTGSIVVAESLLSGTRETLTKPFSWDTALSPANCSRPSKPPDAPRNVKIMYFDTGGGHRSAAQSVEAALKRLYGDRVHVELVESSSKLPAPWCYASEIYTWLGQHPSIYERLWRADEKVSDFRKSSLYKNMRWNCIKHIKVWVAEAVLGGADLFLSVHPFCNHLLGDVLEHDGPNAAALPPWATVVTDLGAAHVSWFDPRANAVFVPTEELRERALQLEVADERVHVYGLPVRVGFWDPVGLSKAEARQRLDLLPASTSSARSGNDAEEDYLVVLLMGGGEGFGRLEDVAIAVGEMLAKKNLAKLVVACGRNEELRQKLSEHEWPESALAPPTILGFVTNVDEYMAAADVLLTKAGPGSIAEAAIRGLPCMLTSFLPGQEEGNVDFVTNGGAGEHVPDKDPQGVASRLEEWLGDRELLRRMSKSSKALGRPQATLDIARHIGDLIFPDAAEECVALPAAAALAEAAQSAEAADDARSSADAVAETPAAA
eukprot:TRINITY_DN3435_c0_g8_i1.p1 TRINITY_DN3435_c0_g8~~TRINITY_DN3435_c0_g8_i1.p1  ORF type:complete len:623 (-),score=171.66 TRINITY_DN3435_c0_g8_i1:143-2011(-)